MSIGTFEPTEQDTPAENFAWNQPAAYPGQGLAEDTVVDEVDEAHADEDAEEDEDPAGAGSAKARPAARPSRAQYRRVAAKALEVAAADASVRSAAASVLGAPEDPADLAAHIMTAPRLATSPLRDIDQIAAEIADEPWQAGITAASWEPARQKGVWGVLRALGAVDADQPPASQAKAAKPILAAVNSLGEDQRRAVAAAAELLRRS